MKLCSSMTTWLEKKVAPRRLIGSPATSRPMVPRPHASILSCSLRSKMPLGNVRMNFDRIVEVVSEWVGGKTSNVPLVGSLYQESSVIQSTSDAGASDGISR